MPKGPRSKEDRADPYAAPAREPHIVATGADFSVTPTFLGGTAGLLYGRKDGAVVLIDRWLHGVESFDTVVEMRSRRPDVHVVMLSAVLSSIDRAYALACGAVDAIEKPSSLDGWREALASIVGVDTDATPRAA